MEVLRRLDISTETLAAHGVRIYKLGLTYPIEPTRMQEFAHGLDGDAGRSRRRGRSSRTQLRTLFYNAAAAPGDRRQARCARARRCVSALGELRPSRLIEIVADWLVAPLPRPRPPPPACATSRCPSCCRNASDSVKRLPYFCAGCPHNTSHQGARRLARAGRHRLPLHGELDGPRHRRPDPDGRRRRRLGLARDVHEGAARVPEPGRRHLLPLGLSRDPPGRRGERHASPTRSCSTTRSR